MAEMAGRLAAWARTPAASHGVDVTRCPVAALRVHGTPSALLDATRTLRGPAHDALVVALARQVNRSAVPLWSALLVVAAEEALARVARRFEGCARSPADGAALVVMAFLTVVHGLRSDRPITAVRLRRWTSRQVVAWLRNHGALEGGAPDEPRPRREPAPEEVRRRVAHLLALGAAEAA